MSVLSLLAQTPTPAPNQGGGAASLIFFVVIIGGMYLLMIRPQRARQRAHLEMVQKIEVGDEVETAGGIYGKVRRATDDLIWVEIVPGQEPVKMSRAAIRRRIIEPGLEAPGS